MIQAIKTLCGAQAENKNKLQNPGSDFREKGVVLSVRDLTVHFGSMEVFREVSFAVTQGSVFGLLGPSGRGKSTLLRCLNRLIDLDPSARVEGEVFFKGRNLFGRGVDADMVRSQIGMLFQQPHVFPTTVAGNVLFGVRRLRRVPRGERAVFVERCLREAALWEQVKDRLDAPAHTLSIGQQQRLCLARTLATDPEVILLDEPTSALDTETTEAIEKTFLDLSRQRCLVLVTHDPAQADRVCADRLHL